MSKKSDSFFNILESYSDWFIGISTFVIGAISGRYFGALRMSIPNWLILWIIAPIFTVIFFLGLIASISKRKKEKRERETKEKELIERTRKIMEDALEDKLKPIISNQTNQLNLFANQLHLLEQLKEENKK